MTARTDPRLEFAQALGAGLRGLDIAERLPEWTRGYRDGEAGLPLLPPSNSDLVDAYLSGYAAGFRARWVLAAAEVAKVEGAH